MTQGVTMETTKIISFRDNMASNFGEVLRSSAIFYYVQNSNIKTTITFMNYWKYKRDLLVRVVASVRDMEGRLLHRQPLDFDQGDVVNFRPQFGRDFEGSVEIEVFSVRNMFIPYAAIVALYETQNGITAVHSYARSYSSHETEEGRTITKGEEACWTLRDTKDTRGFAVLHNGNIAKDAQVMKLTLRNEAGRTQSVERSIPAMSPFQTLKIVPRDWFPGLPEFLGERPGYAKLSFVSSGFTRMLVGNESLTGDDLQVTHSNFDYTEQKTDKLESKEDKAYMRVPSCQSFSREVIVYPEADFGRYQIQSHGEQIEFESGKPGRIPVKLGHDQQQVLSFSKINEPLPTRIVTGLVLQKSSNRIPNECSLGVITPLQPPKRLWWGPLLETTGVSSRLVIHDLPEIYKGMAKNQNFSIRVFSSTKQGFLEKSYPASELSRFSGGVLFTEIFPELLGHTGGEAAYYTMYSDYGGLTCYTLFEKEGGSLCLEHGF